MLVAHAMTSPSLGALEKITFSTNTKRALQSLLPHQHSQYAAHSLFAGSDTVYSAEWFLYDTLRIGDAEGDALDVISR